MSSCLWVESTPGECAVVWNDLPNFYGIHIMALVCIAATSIGSVHVLAGAIKQKKYETYTERLPLYRCAADLLFAIAHVMDHIALISRQRYPDEGVGKLLGTLVFVFVCYQILLTTVLSIQSCLVVIFDISLPFGKYEYRAHLLAFLPGVVIFASANAVNGMGPFLYFQGPNITTFQGQAYTLTAIATFIFAISTVILTSYLTITRVNSLKHNAGKKKLTPQLKQAVRRLNSFMIGACGQWIPCAVLLATCLGAERLPYGFRMFLLYFGIMGANLGGVFNSAAYLYNQSHYNIAISSKTSGVHSNSAGTQGASHGRKSEAAKGDGPANGSFKHLTVQPSGAHGSTPKINTADTSLTNVTATSRHELDRKVQL